MDAVTDEYDGGVDVGGFLAGLVLGHDFGTIGEIDWLGCLSWCGHEREFCLVFDGVDCEEGDFLEKCAVFAGGFQTGKGELSRNILGCQLGAALAGAASFQQVKREKTDVGADSLGVDGGCGRTRGRWQTLYLGNGRAGGFLGVGRRDKKSEGGKEGEG